MNPWEEYQDQPSMEASPWEEYAGVEEQPEEKKGFIDGLQDIARALAPAVTAPISGLQEVIRDAAAPHSKAGVNSFVRGVEKDTFDAGPLSVDLSMETETGKKAEELISKGLEAVRGFSGEGMVDLFKNPLKRQFLKTLPHTSLVAELYDNLNPSSKKEFEAIAYAGGATAPEAIALLLGASAVKGKGKGDASAELPQESLDDILGGLRDEQQKAEQAPLDFEKPEMALAEPDAATTVMQPVPKEVSAEFPRYDRGVDFDFNGLDIQKQGELDVTPPPASPSSGLELAPEGAYRTPPSVDVPARPAPDLPLEPQQGTLAFGEPTQRDWTPTEEITLGDDTPSSVANNASGESAASMEAINRLQSQNASGVRIVEFDPDKGTITPLVTADRVDKRAAQGKAILQIDADGKVTMVENNSRYGNTPLQNRLDYEMKKQGDTPAGGTGFGKGQRGSIGVYDKKPKTLETLAGEMSKEDWTKEFSKQRPDDAAFAGAAYDRLRARQDVAKRAKVDSKFVDAADTALGLISTRLGNEHPVIERAAKANEQKRMQGIANGLSTADQFLTDINPKIRGGFNEADRNTINSMLLDNDLASLEKRLTGVKGKSGKDLGQELKNTRQVIDRLGNELYQRKIIGNLRQEYWPRVVKDYEGLSNALGYETKSALDKYVNEVRTKYENRGEAFDQQAMSDTVNGFLHSRERTTGAPYSKQRRMDKIPDNLKPFYATPTESLHSYIRWSNDKIAEHDFFGKSLRRDAEDKIDLGGSINDYIGEQLANGTIKPEQMDTVRKLLTARFRGGQNIAHGGIQTYKDINNLTLLTDFTTTVSQAFDTVPSLWMNGVVPTLQSTVMQLARKNKEDVKDVAGIMDHFAEEFVGNRKSSEYVVKAFKATGFSQMGRLAQNISTNAARISRQKEAVLGKPDSRLYREYQTYFGKDFPQLVDDLKNNKKTPLTDELLFSELSRMSPISKLEKTEWGLNHPNAGGLLYALKSFVLKQADINRREIYNQYKAGNIKQATKAAAALTAFYAMSDIAYQDIKDFWANKPISDRTAFQIAISNLRMMGADKHFSEQLSKGNVASAITGAIAPPTRHLDIVGREAKGVVNLGLDAALGEDIENPRPKPTGEILTLLPFGDALYGRFTEKGQARRERLEELAE